MYYSLPPRGSRLEVSPKVSHEDSDYLYDKPVVYDLFVYDDEDIDTGIVDAEGYPIIRTENIPLGYLADLFDP